MHYEHPKSLWFAEVSSRPGGENVKGTDPCSREDQTTPLDAMNSALQFPIRMEQQHTGPQALRILVVEDNRDAAMTLKTLLVMKGYVVHNAYDGLKAVEAVASFKPDVVILDIGLPDISGHEVARRIRASKGGKDVRMIALTAWGDVEQRQRSAAVGCEHHLVKPVRLTDLMRVLEQ